LLQCLLRQCHIYYCHDTAVTAYLPLSCCVVYLLVSSCSQSFMSHEHHQAW